MCFEGGGASSSTGWIIPANWSGAAVVRRLNDFCSITMTFFVLSCSKLRVEDSGVWCRLRDWGFRDRPQSWGSQGTRCRAFQSRGIGA